MPSESNPILGTLNSFYLEINELPDDEESRLRVMISYSDGSTDNNPPNKICIKFNDYTDCFNSRTGFQFGFKDEDEGEDDGDPDRDKVEFELQGCSAAAEESVTINIMLLADGHISFPASHIVDVRSEYPTKIVNGETECRDDEK